MYDKPNVGEMIARGKWRAEKHTWRVGWDKTEKKLLDPVIDSGKGIIEKAGLSI